MGSKKPKFEVKIGLKKSLNSRSTMDSKQPKFEAKNGLKKA